MLSPKMSFFYSSKPHSDFVVLFWDWFRGEVPVLSVVGDPGMEQPPAAARAVPWEGSQPLSEAIVGTGGDPRD